MSVLAGCKIFTLTVDSALDAFMVIRIQGKVQISRITKLEIMCMQYPVRPAEGAGAPELELDSKLPHWCWDLNQCLVKSGQCS